MGIFDFVKKFIGVGESGSGIVNIYSPVDGVVLDQKDIPDSGFSEGAMGKGVGLDPHNGNVKAYMDGELTVLYPTNHASFMQDSSGISVMLHFGINTSEIEKEKNAFSSNRTQGDNLKVGDDLVTADLDVIKNEGKSKVSAFLVQEDNMQGKTIKFHKKPGDVVKAGELLMTVHQA